MPNYNYDSRKDVYLLLLDMSENMNKLFSSLDIEEDKSNIVTPHPFIYFLECIINRGTVAQNMEQLNNNMKRAIKKSDDRRLENWSNNLNIEKMQNEILDMENTIKQLKEQIGEVIKEKEQERKENELLRSELSKLEKVYNSELDKYKKRNIDNIMSTISFRDSIIMRDGLAENQPESEKLRLLLASLVKETANLLTKNNVSILDQKGKFDSSKQIVVEAQQTDNEELHDSIAQVFRPGYMYEDKMLRPEEVILYIYKQDLASREIGK